MYINFTKLMFSRCKNAKRGEHMAVYDYQISSVIRSYIKNMKTQAYFAEKVPSNNSVSGDRVIISEEAFKRILFTRIGGQMVERLRKQE